jgi:predicted TIM-barrel fold metal-dependent hydrolase
MISRRAFVASCGAAIVSAQSAAEPIIDIHQHTTYVDRTNADLVAHQRAMGVTKTVLLPAGSKYGLAAKASGNDSVLELARQYPKEYVFFANELPDLPETKAVITKYLKLGAIGIGEQKFPVEADSKHIQLIAEIARDFKVPVLLHFEHKNYNLGFERFHKILDKYPSVNFIGHAQTWWGNIDKNHDQTVMYPKTKVTPGGITDRLLADYANMFADMSAGSGLNALLRDEDHARGFLNRHQDKLLYGSDCPDNQAGGEKCSGAKQIAAIRRLAPSKRVERKILYGNASRVLKIT